MQSRTTRVDMPLLLWSAKMGHTYSKARPQSIGDRVFAWDTEDIMVVLDASTGTVIEHHPSPGRLCHKPPVIDDVIAFLCVARDGTTHTAICAYDWQQREVNWIRETGEVADLVVSRDQVFAVTRDGIITTLDKKDGTFRWSHRLRRTFWEPCLVDGGGELYVSAEGKAAFATPSYVDATKGYVLVLDSLSGDLRWIYCTGGEVHHPPVLAETGIYVGDSGSNDRHIYRLNKSPGTRLGERIWRYDLEGSANCGALAGDALYWGGYDHHLYALDAHTGALRWRYKARGPVANYGPPCVWGDWVFAPASDGYLYGLDARSGALRWKYFVSPDALHEAEKGAPLITSAGTVSEDVDAELKREEDEYSASLARETTDIEQDGEEEEPSPPHLLVWNTERHIFLLAHGGLLHCFALPREQQ